MNDAKSLPKTWRNGRLLPHKKSRRLDLTIVVDDILIVIKTESEEFSFRTKMYAELHTDRYKLEFFRFVYPKNHNTKGKNSSCIKKNLRVCKKSS